MNKIMLITLCLIIPLTAALSGCSKESDKSVIPGYWSPGDFRPRGVAREKCYNFGAIIDNSTTPATTGKTCSSGAQTAGICSAVYGLWLHGTSYQNSIASEGIAVKNTNETNQNFMIKIVRFVGQEWNIIMNLNGTVYTAQTSALELTTCDSVDETTPAYTPPATTTTPNPTPLAGTGVRLKLMYVRFLQDITLTSSSGTTTISRTGDLPDSTHPPTWYEAVTTTVDGQTVTTYVQHYNLPTSGDYILAQAY